jgi:hypothetical protein
METTSSWTALLAGRESISERDLLAAACEDGCSYANEMENVTAETTAVPTLFLPSFLRAFATDKQHF